jgi:hypothetical protein
MAKRETTNRLGLWASIITILFSSLLIASVFIVFFSFHYYLQEFHLLFGVRNYYLYRLLYYSIWIMPLISGLLSVIFREKIYRIIFTLFYEIEIAVAFKDKRYGGLAKLNKGRAQRFGLKMYRLFGFLFVASLFIYMNQFFIILGLFYDKVNTVYYPETAPVVLPKSDSFSQSRTINYWHRLVITVDGKGLVTLNSGNDRYSTRREVFQNIDSLFARFSKDENFVNRLNFRFNSQQSSDVAKGKFNYSEYDINLSPPETLVYFYIDRTIEMQIVNELIAGFSKLGIRHFFFATQPASGYNTRQNTIIQDRP